MVDREFVRTEKDVGGSPSATGRRTIAPPPSPVLLRPARRYAASPGLSSPPTRRQQAVYQREIVRRYNGGVEFRYKSGDFEIFQPRRSRARRVRPCLRREQIGLVLQR